MIIPYPKIKNVQITPQYEVVRRYLTSRFWLEENDDLFAPDITVEFPVAVPGIPQYLNAFEYETFRIFLRNTVSNHEDEAEPVIIPTTEPDVFWACRWVKSDVYWAKRNGVFRSEIFVRLTVKDGKLQNIRELVDQVAFYDAIDIVLPNFNYLLDIKDDVPSVRMEKGQVSKFTREQNRQRSFRNFTNPVDGWDGDPEPIYAEDMEEVTAFVPKDMLEHWKGVDFDRQTEWMMRISPEWHPQTKVWYTCDPDVIVVDGSGWGVCTWSNHVGHYTQREIQFIHVDEQGKVDQFRCYFNSINKFASMNQMVPSFPYFMY